MNKSLTLLVALGTFAFTACSSLDVSSSEAYEDNYPKDFQAETYMNLHPALRSLQIQDYVSALNDAATVDSLTFAVDTAMFFGDTATLHQIYANPLYAGYSEELWQDDWTAMTVVDTTFKLDTLALKVADLIAKKPIEVLNVKLTYSAEGKITNVSGEIKDSVDATKMIPVSYDIDDSAYSVVKLHGATTQENLEKFTIDTTVTLGGIPADKKKQLLKFNFKTTTEDLAALAAIPVDWEAISLQYVFYGRTHGWAYRLCSDAESMNPIQAEEVYPATKTYCVDAAGIVREIAE